MRSFKTILLAGASALLAAASFAAPASAQVNINGAGSSLLSPYFAHAAGCYVGTDNYTNPGALAADLATRFVQVSGGTNTIQDIPTADCTPMGPGADRIQNLSSGSGNGIVGVYSGDTALLGSFPSGTSFSPIVYGLSDAALTSADTSVWTSGGTEQGKVFASTGGDYPIPSTAGGNLIQIPASIDPVALTYNPQYTNAGTNYSLHISNADGVLHLPQAVYCKIMNHQLTDWNQLSPAELSAVNGGVSLKDTADTHTFSAPIHLVGRLENSGTTFLFYRHMIDACNGMTGNQFTGTPAQQLPASLQPSYSLQTGSGGVATRIGNNPGSIGYIGADFVLPFVSYTHATTFSLPAAALQNKHLDFVKPSSAAAAIPYAGLTPPTTGASDPLNWVPSIANPIDAGAYPITGTTNMILAQKHDADTVAALIGDPALGSQGFLGWYYDSANNQVNDDTTGILAKSGLAPMPSAWLDAITANFVKGTANSGALQIMPTP